MMGDDYVSVAQRKRQEYEKTATAPAYEAADPGVFFKASPTKSAGS